MKNPVRKSLVTERCASRATQWGTWWRIPTFCTPRTRAAAVELDIEPLRASAPKRRAGRAAAKVESGLYNANGL